MKISKILTLVVVTLLAVLAFSSCNSYMFENDECKHKSTTTSIFAKATCSTEGLRRTICSECGVVLKVEKIEKTAHKEVIDEAIEQTCSEYGRTEGKHCSVCDQVIVPRKVVAKKPHIEVVDEAVAATCANVGFTEGKHCSVCNEVIVAPEVIEMKPHTEVIDRAVAATCISSGLTEGKHCSKCNKILVPQEIISNGGHRAGKWIIDAEATCTEDGSKHQICNLCNETIVTEQIAATGHSYSITVINGTCNSNGKKIYICKTCGYSYEEAIDPITLSFVHTSTSSATVNGYGSYSKGYSIIVTGGYGTILLKYELYTSATATNPTSTIDFTTDTATSVSFKGYENAIDNYVYKITAKDEDGNISVYRFSLRDTSIIDYYVEKKPHTEVVDAAVQGSCFEAGLTEGKHCSVCGTIIVAQEYIYEHNFVDSVILKEATKSEDGLIEKYCDCGFKITEVIPATGSLGLEFASNGDGTCYVSDIGTCSDTDIIIPQVSPQGDSVTSIGDCAFKDCTGLTSIEIPDSVETIGEDAFKSCYNLSEITLGESLRAIGDDAFWWCTDLTSIVIPNSVTSIGKWAFMNCKNLVDVYYTGTAAEWAEISIDYGNSYLENATIHYNYVPAN